MTVHLIKMAVGIRDLDELRERRRRRDMLQQCLVHTRSTPRRADEVLDGGSLYWVIRGQVQVRQRVLRILTSLDEDGQSFCTLDLDPELVPTLYQPCRPFQGWRYLDPAKAPPDRGDAPVDDALPPHIQRELRELGLL
jgi:hypothetical protein